MEEQFYECHLIIAELIDLNNEEKLIKNNFINPQKIQLI